MILDTGKEVFEKDKDFILTKKKNYNNNLFLLLIALCSTA